MAEEKVSEIIESVSPYYASIKKKKVRAVPGEEHEIIYDSSSETLEPVYFWILDYMNDTVGNVEKLVDNFVSSPGSGHFAELGMRATRMQEEGMKMLGSVNTVLKSIINLIYDLKEFEIRLDHYNAAQSKDPQHANAGLLALKQMWMDNVDIKRGRGSINMLTQDLNFVTLRDSFLIAKSVKDVGGLDLNERVKRILKPRLQEFLAWKTRSETELRKRFEIERQYLKSQVNSLKLYTRWAKPYLEAAEKLRMQETGREPALVNIFNTLMLQLTLMARSKINIEQEIVNKNVPEEFKKLKKSKNYRDYYACVLVDFKFRGIPQRVSAQQQHYAFGGRVEVTFKGYCLNEDEIAKINEKLGESEIEGALRLIEGTTAESLDQLREDIEKYIEGEESGGEESGEKQDVNPFSALFGVGKKKKKTVKKSTPGTEKLPPVKPDSYVETLVRSLGEQGAKEKCFKVFDIYKKAHGMKSHPDPYG